MVCENHFCSYWHYNISKYWLMAELVRYVQAPVLTTTVKMLQTKYESLLAPLSSSDNGLVLKGSVQQKLRWV